MAVFVGIPTHDYRLHARLCTRLLEEAGLPRSPSFTVGIRASSLLPLACNWLWCLALNARETYSHFLMLHSDIIPESGFMGKLLEIMEIKRAQVVSVVTPIKDRRGLLSTALIRRPSDPRRLENGRLRRLTLAELESLPETFGAPELAKLWDWGEARDGSPALLVNTGLMLADLRGEWAERVNFEMLDGIAQSAGGHFAPQVRSEDWQFSLLAAAAGAHLVATRAVALEHAGLAHYANREAWGDWEHDRDDL